MLWPREPVETPHSWQPVILTSRRRFLASRAGSRDASFDDPLWQSFADRALATMTGGGADYGECAATAGRITKGQGLHMSRFVQRAFDWLDETLS